MCPHLRSRSCLSIPLIQLLRLLILALFLVAPSTPAYAAPGLWLPTPPGEPWTIIQGYGCGTHGGWDRYSLDLANRDGRTYGAPVRAAADGRIWSWTGKSGTLILDHGDGFYTMYTHMASAVTTQRDKADRTWNCDRDELATVARPARRTCTSPLSPARASRRAAGSRCR